MSKELFQFKGVKDVNLWPSLALIQTLHIAGIPFLIYGNNETENYEFLYPGIKEAIFCCKRIQAKLMETKNGNGRISVIKLCPFEHNFAHLVSFLISSFLPKFRTFAGISNSSDHTS